MDELCITTQEVSKLLGISVRMVQKYIKRGTLKAHHRVGRQAMVDVSEVYGLREEKRKRGF